LTDSRFIPIARRIARHITPGALLLLLLTGCLYVAALQLAHLFLLDEAGYGDSYVLYDVQHFEKTGVIYRDLSQPPYMPAQYGPLVYMLYALPRRVASENPFFGPRVAALAAFFLCVAMVVSIVRVLIPARSAWLWGLLISTSITSLQTWPLQLRGDFPGIFFGLATIRLLLVRSRYTVLLAGICAGLATHFKITYVAALIAGSLWLLLRRRWKDLTVFVAAGASISAGLYLLFWLREPRMLSQMMALAPGIRDLPGGVRVFISAIREPVVLLALPALPLVILRRWPRWGLLLLFVLVSFGVGGLTDIQAGGNINYFYEGLFALTPFSVLGAFRLIAWSRQRAAIALFLTGLILIHFWLLDAEDLYGARSGINPWEIKAQNALFRRTGDALRGQHIFSTIPRIALFDPHPALMEPYLLSYLQRLGKANPQPIVERIRSDEFDLVITGQSGDSWRGIPKIGPDLRNAIVAAYMPYCTVLSKTPGVDIYVLFLPRHRTEDAILIQKLHQIGCIPYQQSTTPTW
jgi:phage shock protein PspC (stress-responsive transcriptional regulator)